MKLDAYIRTHDTTEEQLAEKAGCSQSALNRVRNGIGNPTFGLLRKISEATGGEFTPGEFEPAKAIGNAPASTSKEAAE